MMMNKVASLLTLLAATAIAAPAPLPAPPPLKVIYFTPADTQPFPDAHERLGRVMRHVQEFYRAEMQRNGLPPLTFALEWDAPSRLKLYRVTGRRNLDGYGRDDFTPIRDEIRAALRDRHATDIDKEVILVFQTALRQNPDGTFTEIGPYCASGSHLAGTAFVYDHPLLDADSLPSQAPGGYYNGPCSIGQFNTHYIGGVAHELGHAFGLPHNAETAPQRQALGLSLMGGGNHTYGNRLRGKSPDTFLSHADALRLARIRAFAGDLPNARHTPAHSYTRLAAAELPATPKGRALTLTGHLQSDIPATAIIAYNDCSQPSHDYDTIAFTALPDPTGAFTLTLSEIKDHPYQLRLAAVHANGAVTATHLEYAPRGGALDLAAINNLVPLHNLRRLLLARDAPALRALAQNNATPPFTRDLARHALAILAPPATVTVADLPASVRRADLTHAAFAAATVGWHRNVHRGTLPEDAFIQLGGQTFTSALYAHAPSRITLDLAAKWQTLDIGYGRQDGHRGTLVFTILADGRQLHRSPVIDAPGEHRVTLPVAGVRTLEFLAEPPPGVSNNDAWSIWSAPTLTR